MGSYDSTLQSEEVEEIRAELPQCLLYLLFINKALRKVLTLFVCFFFSDCERYQEAFQTLPTN